MNVMTAVAVTYGAMLAPLIIAALAVHCFTADPKDPWEDD